MKKLRKLRENLKKEISLLKLKISKNSTPFQRIWITLTISSLIERTIATTIDILIYLNLTPFQCIWITLTISGLIVRTIELLLKILNL